MSESEAERRDLEAIRALHERDMAAAREGDADALSALWTDDMVALAPGAPIRRGKEDNLASLRQSLEASADWETLDYTLRFEEVHVVGDYAWDWGTFEGTVRHRLTGETARSTGKLLRILRRDPDGEWRVHRTIWNNDPPPGQ